MSSRFDLVIFDCDGVVVDSEPITDRVFGEFIRGLGLSLSRDEAHELFLGRKLADCIRIVEERLGLNVSAEALEDYRARRDRALRAEVESIEGIADVLQRLTIPYCIASSGDHSKMRITLDVCGLMSYFDGRIFSATEVERGKPAPDLFLYAAEKMHAEPARTAVIEDSVHGVTAAHAAGMTALAYAPGNEGEKLEAAGAAAIFSHMRELPKLLA